MLTIIKWHSVRAVSLLVFASFVMRVPVSGVDVPRFQAIAVTLSDADTTSIREARNLLLAGYYQRAELAYTNLANKPETALEARLGLARCRLETGEYYPAIEELESHQATDSPDWHFVLANAYRNVGRYKDTIEHARAAIRLDKNHSPARFLLADTLEYLGRREEAIDTYKWFDRRVTEMAHLPGDAEWLTSTALGFVRFSVLTQTDVPRRTRHALHDMLQNAYDRVDPKYWPARIAAADLLRDKYNNDEFDGSVSDYKAALLINSRLPQAHVGLGEVALEKWAFQQVKERAELALQTNPRFLPALNLLAKNLIYQRRYVEAIEVCDRALEVNPNDLSTLSISAAAGACNYNHAHVEAMARRVAKINPCCSLFHRALGGAFGGIRQFEDSEREYLKAVELDPTDVNVRTELGMMYMQWGDELKARSVLEVSWTLDPYNQRTKLTLDLLDKLEDFARTETDHFIIKYDSEMDPGLGTVVAHYLEDVYPQVTADYGFQPPDKTIVEFFPEQRGFGVRISGKPWIPTVGACTGRVIAMSSPRESTELAFGSYNIAGVLKHEFTHTVTLAATNNRIPHWLTEGLAVGQEDRPRSFSWRKLLADAIRRDRLFTLESIDWGFMTPKRSTDRMQAYAQSEWMCEYIVERFGAGKINAMLKRFAEGWTQPQVFTEELGIETTDFDSDFKLWARRQAQTWGFDLTPIESVLKLRTLALLRGESAEVHARLARAELDADNNQRALEAARRALELNENETTALEVLLDARWRSITKESTEKEIRTRQGEALPLLRRLQELDPESWTPPKMLASIALHRRENRQAIEHLKRLKELCPHDPFSWRALARIYLDGDQEELALPELLGLARLEEHDADIPGRIGLIFKRKGRLSDAQHWLEQALMINPFDVDYHEAAGDVNMRIGDTKAALHNYTMLTKITPEKAKHFEQAAFAAHKLGQKQKAKNFAKRAVQLDPGSPARTLAEGP